MKATVADVMTPDPLVIVEETGFKVIAGLLSANRISALPVVDGDGRLVGVVSEADLLLKEALGADVPHGIFEGGRHRRERHKAEGQVARDLMTAPAVSITGAALITEAAHLLHDRHVKRLPVVDADGHVVGIVTRSDLLKVFMRPDAEIRKEVTEDLIVRTLWMDSNGITVEVTAGVVKLTGTVDRKSDIPILRRLISAVDGVVAVTDNLGFRYDDTRGLEEAWWSPDPSLRPIGR